MRAREKALCSLLHRGFPGPGTCASSTPRAGRPGLDAVLPAPESPCGFSGFVNPLDPIEIPSQQNTDFFTRDRVIGWVCFCLANLDWSNPVPAGNDINKTRQELTPAGILRMELEYMLLLAAAFIILLLVSSYQKPPRRRQHGKMCTSSRHPKFPCEKLDGRIVRISDGDNLIADVSGFGRLNVRLAHIDAPEIDQPGGVESKRELARLLGGGIAQFRLLYRDQYARPVAVVWLENAVINEEMVRLGHAWMYERFIPSSYRPRYRSLMNRRNDPDPGCGDLTLPRFRHGSGVRDQQGGSVEPALFCTL